MYSVYIIQSATGQWYYGFSENVEQRVKEHNTNRSNFTRFKGPWILIFKRDFAVKSEALKFEQQLKRLRNKHYIRATYKDFFTEHFEV